MDCFVGIDVGTTNIKAAIYDIEGNLLAYHNVRSKIIKTKAEWSEFDPNGIWECVCDCLRNVEAKVTGYCIKSIGISSMAEAGVPLDKNGDPLYNIITWYDPRANECAVQLEKKIGRYRIYTLTGQIPSGKYGICKLIWIKQNRPAVFQNMARWLSVEDYIIYRLTGNFETDYSIAARTMAFDIRKLDWSDEILNAAGIDKSILSHPNPGGTKVGFVTPQAAKQTGIKTQVAVVTGGHDHSCAAIGINILEDGVVMDSMGTAEVSMIAKCDLVLNEETYNGYYSIYPHCGKKMYRVLTSNHSCGANIEWYFDSLGKNIAALAEKSGKSKYKIMEEDAVQAEKDGLHFFPFIRGSVESKNMRGAFIGIKDSHRSCDIINAIINGMCNELKLQIDGYEHIFSDSFRKLRVVGGLSKSDFILKRKAEISGRMVEVPINTESACFGAAVLSAIGVGEITLDEISNFYHCGARYDFDERTKHYNRNFEQYVNIRKSLKEIYETNYE